MARTRKPALPTHATVAIGFVTGMLSGMRANAIDPAEPLRAAGISPALLLDADARVPLASYAVLYNAVVRTLDDEGFALFSAPLRPGSFEFLCRSVLTSRTLAEALDRSARFLWLVLPDLTVDVARERASAELVITERQGAFHGRDAAARTFAYEWLLRLLHGLSCWLVARELSLDTVAFPYPKPRHAADYALIYTARSTFGGDALTARLNANLLDLPIRRDEQALSTFLVGAPGKIAVLFRRDREMVRRVRDILTGTLPRAISFEDVAHELHLSPRSLHRHLHEEESSFRAIKDALRRDVALARLEKTRDPVAKIAADLGYAEPSTFFRAFQGWTGVAPTAYRKRLAR